MATTAAARAIQGNLPEQGKGSIENMDRSDYERLQHDVEELLGRWEETAQEEGPGGMEDTPLNRLIAERFEIEQMILASRGDDVGEDELEDEMDTQWG